MEGCFAISRAATAIRNISVAVTAGGEGRQTNDTHADIAVGQGYTATIFRHGDLHVIRSSYEIVLRARAPDRFAVSSIVQVNTAIAIGVATKTGVIIAGHLGNRHMQTDQADPNRLTGFHNAIIVTLTFHFLQAHGNPVTAHHLIGSARSSLDPEDIIAGYDLGGVRTVFTVKYCPGAALVMAYCHFGNCRSCVGRKLQLTAAARKVQGIKLCIPGTLGSGIIGNMVRISLASTCKAIDTEVYGAVITANLHHHKSGTGRIGRAVNAVVRAAGHFHGAIGHFNDRHTRLQRGQGHPVAVSGGGRVLFRQADHILTGENGISKIRGKNIILIADFNDFPSPVGL